MSRFDGLQKFLSGQTIERIIHVGAGNGGEEIDFYNSLNAKFVVWIEANSSLIQDLKNNLNRATFESRIFNTLITDKVGESTDFHLYYSGSNTGMSSILKKTSGACGREDAEFNKKNFYVGTVQMESDTLDNLLESDDIDFSFDLINIDLQGSELVAFRGAERLLKNSSNINTEVTFHTHDYDGGVYFQDLKEYLEQFDFTHRGETDICGDGSWGDSFFSK